MPNPDVEWNRAVPNPDDRWKQFTASLPMRTALLAVATVWVLGAVWSFTEQTAFAANKGFAFPHLLPLVIDGFAIAMAGVAWAASLDARPAVSARLATLIAVVASSASNGAWAYIRSNRDMVAVLLGVAVPIAANLAFEVLLAELRRQVQRRRGMPPPVAIPYPRLIRLGLAPFRTFVEWRTLVLELTRMDLAVAPRPAPTAPRSPAPTVQSAPTVHPAPAATQRPVETRDAAPVVQRSADTAPVQADPAVQARQLDSANGSQPEDRPKTARSTPSTRSTRVTKTPSSTDTARPTAASPQAEAPPPARTASRQPKTETVRPAARRRDLEAVPTSAPSADSTGDSRAAATRTSNGNGRRTVDSRVEMLAAHLAGTEDAGEFTGEMVGPLLGIEVAPRTGRRLLGLARELVAERAQAELDRHDPELSVIGGRAR